MSKAQREPATAGVQREPAAAGQRPLRCIPLHSPELVAGFRQLESLFRRCLGAGGCGALHATEAGRADLLCCSESLLSALCVSPPLALVTAAVRQQVSSCGDGGLATGTLLAGLLSRLLVLQLPRHTVRRALQTVSDVCRDALQESMLRMELEVPQLMAVVRTVLCSKAAVVCLTAAERRHLSLQLLRAFLQSVPADVTDPAPARMGHVHVQLAAGGDVTESCVMTSLLLRQPALDDLSVTSPLWRRSGATTGGGRCILVSCHLGDQDAALAETNITISADLSQRCLSAERWISSLSELDLSSVWVLACQRPVHVQVHRWLAARGVLCLERLGGAGASLFARLTGAQPVAGTAMLAEIRDELEQMQGGSSPASTLTGSLDAVRRLCIAGESYAELERRGAPVVTLLVHYPQPELQQDILKRQLEASLLALTGLLSDRTVVPGGGCLEAVLHAAVTRHTRHADAATRRVAGAVCSVLRQNALATAGSRGHLCTDTIYRHAWEAELPGPAADGGSCVCGLVRSGDLRGGAELRELAGPFCSSEAAEDESPCGEVNKATVLDPGEISELTLVDSARVKGGALNTALHACHAILAVGSCVMEKT